jgi:hypothetical protein
MRIKHDGRYIKSSLFALKRASILHFAKLDLGPAAITKRVYRRDSTSSDGREWRVVYRRP